MKTQGNNSPTESRKYSFFTNFKNSKRIVWYEHRNYNY